ncbi:MAG: terpene cyclase/mutase family protein [Planctomycetes bacterium]|jgi:hypothetical protein|nr:terpene cyclase/mutase family protein [Planctomycetota bacterium]
MLLSSIALCVTLIPVWPVQDPPPAALPTLLRAGPLPADLPSHTMPGIGNLPPWPADRPELVLRATPSASAGLVIEQLTTAIAAGTRHVHLAAAVPDGREGAILLALPEAADAPTLLTLRAHHERTGVPPSSVTPLLRRLRSGWRALHTVPFVLEVLVPANATYGQLLPLVAACAEAGDVRLVLRTQPGDPGQAAPRTAFALDLESVLLVAVEPRELAAASGLADAPIGGRERAPAAAVAIGEDGGAGGRYGGRGGRARDADPSREALLRSLHWLGNELPFGIPAGDRLEAIETTALIALCLLADGSHLAAGDHSQPLRRAIGALVAAQHDDGGFGLAGPRSTTAQAVAAYALTEAYGLSPTRGLVHGPAQLALDRLIALRGTDGGWHDGDREAASDACSTAWAMSAIASAEFFRLRTGAGTAELIAWFDQHPQQEPRAAAAELFAHFFAGRSGEQFPREALSDLITERAAASDPETCYWATFALFQNGGRQWAQWLPRLDAAVVNTQDQGAAAGSWQPPAGQSRRRATALWALALSARSRYTRLVR